MSADSTSDEDVIAFLVEETRRQGGRIIAKDGRIVFEVELVVQQPRHMGVLTFVDDTGPAASHSSHHHPTGTPPKRE